MIMNNVKISLAGDLGSGKSTVGKILAPLFGAEIYSTGTIQRNIALQMGMSTLELNRYMETHPEIDGMIDDGLRALEKEEKNLIIDSRMAWHFVPSSFSVYMAAAPRISAERILAAGRESEHFSSVEEAETRIAERRQSEMLRYSQLYGVNIKDLENYNYVVDTSFITPQTAAEHIAAHYKKFAAGETFARYELCPARLLPTGAEEGGPAFYEEDGRFYIAGGEREIAESIRGGAQLIACRRAAKPAGAGYAPARAAAWEKQTSIRLFGAPGREN